MNFNITNIYSPAPREIWQTLMQDDPEAIPYQSPTWLDCACSSAGYEDASRLYEFADGTQLILPLLQYRFGPFEAAYSLPDGWGIGGAISSRPLQPLHIRAVMEDLRKSQYLRVSVRPNPRSGQLWQAGSPTGVTKVERFAHVLDLTGGFDEVWNTRFSKRTRKGVRRAERAGLDIECDTTGRLIPVFHELLKCSFERWSRKQNEPRALTFFRGLRRDPLQKFETIAKHFGSACRLWVAWYQGEPAAAMLILQDKNVNDARGAMNEEIAGPTGANDLLQKLAIEEACNAGCRYYHLGESGASAGLAHYKERFGAIGYAYNEYYFERLPITKTDKMLRSLVKRAIGFRDVAPDASTQKEEFQHA